MLRFRDYRGVLVDAPADRRRILESLDDGLIVWSCTNSTHQVRYGLQVKQFRGKDRDIEAAKEFGLCVRHKIECDGKLEPEYATK